MTAKRDWKADVIRHGRATGSRGSPGPYRRGTGGAPRGHLSRSDPERTQRAGRAPRGVRQAQRVAARPGPGRAHPDAGVAAAQRPAVGARAHWRSGRRALGVASMAPCPVLRRHRHPHPRPRRRRRHRHLQHRRYRAAAPAAVRPAGGSWSRSGRATRRRRCRASGSPRSTSWTTAPAGPRSPTRRRGGGPRSTSPSRAAIRSASTPSRPAATCSSCSACAPRSGRDFRRAVRSTRSDRHRRDQRSAVASVLRRRPRHRRHVRSTSTTANTRSPASCHRRSTSPTTSICGCDCSGT